MLVAEFILGSTNVVSSNPAQVRSTRYNIMWSSLSVTYGMSVVFSGTFPTLQIATSFPEFPSL